jgi:3-hydroxyisobutyrate dehydrogenase-like beta-hydroxyacid dehydrogenase
MAMLGFVGLGSMGAWMSARLVAAGESVVVYDVRPEAVAALASKGAAPAASLRELADTCDTVFLSLPMPDVVEAVVTGPGGLLEGSALRRCIDLSTTGTTVAVAVAASCAARGVAYLDSPVSGGPAGAENGTLTVMAAGDRSLFDDLRKYLEVFGTNVVHVGDSAGQGQLTKVINNLLSATALAITAEAVALGVKGGLDPATLIEVINTSSGRNTATLDKFPRCILPRKFDFGFRLRLMQKDVGLCLQEATNFKIPMLVSTMVQQLWTTAAAELPADADITDLAKVVERWAGVTIGGDAAS